MAATFGWLCVETCVRHLARRVGDLVQPPSGGCVLKLAGVRGLFFDVIAATFGWLCVETSIVEFSSKL